MKLEILLLLQGIAIIVGGLIMWDIVHYDRDYLHYQQTLITEQQKAIQGCFQALSTSPTPTPTRTPGLLQLDGNTIDL